MGCPVAYCAWVAVGVVCIELALFVRRTFFLPRRPAADNAIKKGRRGHKIVAYGFGVAAGVGDVLRSNSPACEKIFAFLHLSGLDYEYKLAKKGPGGAPKGKLPYIEHGDDIVADSAHIIDYVINTYADEGQTHLGKLRLDLTPEQHAVGTAVVEMCDNTIYNAMVHGRWLGSQAALLRDRMLDMIPPGVRHLVHRSVQVAMESWLYGQGFLRHSAQDREGFVLKDLAAIHTFLGEKPFLLGDEPSVYDCALFASIENFSTCITASDERRRFFAEHPEFRAFVARMRAMLPPPYKKSVKKAQ